jgi:hypothetical protein
MRRCLLVRPTLSSSKTISVHASCMDKWDVARSNMDKGDVARSNDISMSPWAIDLLHLYIPPFTSRRLLA